MDELTQELVAASLQLRPFLKASTDKRYEGSALDHLQELYAGTPADRLRRDAEEMEAHDAAVIRFRNALAAVAPTPDSEKPAESA